MYGPTFAADLDEASAILGYSYMSTCLCTAAATQPKLPQFLARSPTL